MLFFICCVSYFGCIDLPVQYNQRFRLLAASLLSKILVLSCLVKVVHRSVSKKILQKWVTYSAAAFSWISGFALSIGITIRWALAALALSKR